MKKIVTVILLFLLCACSTKEIDKTNEYIKPLNEINFLNEINDEKKTQLASIYGREEVKNNLLEMVDKRLTDLCVKDYYDNDVDFLKYYNSEIVFEIVQYSCEHCLKQTALTDIILENSDITFIQYFAWGTKEQIDDFYARAKRDMNDKVIVIPQNDELSDYISELKVDETPTFLFFKNGKLKFADTGEIALAKFSNIVDYAYNDNFGINDLVNNDGVSLFDLYRGYDDVLADLSNENKDKLALVDNSEEVTINTIGNHVDYKTLYEKDGEPLYSIKSFNSYINKDTVVFYVANMNDNLKKDISVINGFISNHQDLKVLTILMDNKDFDTSTAYQELGLMGNFDVVSSTSEIPKVFIDVSVVSYPAAIFIQDDVMTGGFNQIKDIDSLERAYQIFMGDDSLALLKNN